MDIPALARLRHRSALLERKLASAATADTETAREMLRQSLVELYQLGYWREHPGEFRSFMRLFRARPCLSAPPSMSGLGRTDQCNP